VGDPLIDETPVFDTLVAELRWPDGEDAGPAPPDTRNEWFDVGADASPN
jgi:hypothetical protein